MVISLEDQAKIWRLLLEGKPEEAQKLSEQLKQSTIAVEQVLQEIEQQIEQQRPIYLTYASPRTQLFFQRMSLKEQKHAMEHIKYLPEWILFLDDTWKKIALMTHADHSVSKEHLVPWKIEKDEEGNTRFNFAAIKNNEYVPTNDQWENMLRCMPAWDFTGDKCRAWKQLHGLLWGKLTDVHINGVCGSFRSRNKFGVEYALVVDNVLGKLTTVNSWSLHLVRLLVEPEPQIVEDLLKSWIGYDEDTRAYCPNCTKPYKHITKTCTYCWSQIKRIIRLA